MKAKSKLKNKTGFSILEVVAAIFIFSVVTMTIYGAFSAGLKSLAQSKHRIAASELANEKMEIIRNMKYSDVGTQGGVPSGALPQNETVWKSNQKFNIHTFIRYIDDPEDGLGENDENMVTTDSKEVKVEVAWAGVKTGHGVRVVSKFVPDGVETDVGGGTLRVNILDGSGAGVAGVETHIANNSVNPAVVISTYTDFYGTILMSGMPVADRTYEISVSKDGYESVDTSPPYPVTAYDPTDVHASVSADGDLNTKGIIIDKLSNLHIYARDILDYDNLFPNVNFEMKGGRVIGLEYGTIIPVKNYDQNLVTGASGDVSAEGIPPGQYEITLNEPGYTIISTEPALPIALAPDQSIDVQLILASNATNSLIVDVRDSETESPLPYASVHLYNGSDFDDTEVTGEEGRVYFPPHTDPPTTLPSGNFTLDVTEPNHQDYSDSVSVSGLSQRAVDLIPNTP
jgi:hypothetical protein